MPSGKKRFWIYSETVELRSRALPHLREHVRNRLERVRFMTEPRSPKPRETNDSCRLEFWRCQTVMCGCSIGSEFGNLKTPGGKDREINLTCNQKSLRFTGGFFVI
jgi:hypothetical protein